MLSCLVYPGSESAEVVAVVKEHPWYQVRVIRHAAEQPGDPADDLRVTALHAGDPRVLCDKAVQYVGLDAHALDDFRDPPVQLVASEGVRIPGCDHDYPSEDGVQLVEAVFESPQDAAHIPQHDFEPEFVSALGQVEEIRLARGLLSQHMHLISDRVRESEPGRLFKWNLAVDRQLPAAECADSHRLLSLERYLVQAVLGHSEHPGNPLPRRSPAVASNRIQPDLCRVIRLNCGIAEIGDGEQCRIRSVLSILTLKPDELVFGRLIPVCLVALNYLGIRSRPLCLIHLEVGDCHGLCPRGQPDRIQAFLQVEQIRFS